MNLKIHPIYGNRVCFWIQDDVKDCSDNFSKAERYETYADEPVNTVTIGHGSENTDRYDKAEGCDD